MARLNKSIKTHIADMAIREKYKAAFDKHMELLLAACYKALYKKYHNDDFKVLSKRALELVSDSSHCNTPEELRMDEGCKSRYSYGNRQGYKLNAALETRCSIDSIKMPDRVYGTSYRFNFPDEAKPEWKALKAILKEASEARKTLINAMDCYKSASKMFKELPWTETYYPEEEKKPKCNIVPVSTIAAANDLMGIK